MDEVSLTAFEMERELRKMLESCSVGLPLKWIFTNTLCSTIACG